MTTKTVISKFSLPTVNRGTVEFVVSVDKKGYYVHELCELTSWARIMGSGEQIAHQIISSTRIGNQYGKYWRPKPLKSYHSALIAAQIHSKLEVQYF